jgi:hypothetical protein
VDEVTMLRFLRLLTNSEGFALFLGWFVASGCLIVAGAAGRSIGYQQGTERLASANAELRKQLHEVEGRAQACHDRYAGRVVLWGGQVEQGTPPTATAELAPPPFSEDGWYRLSIWAKGDRLQAEGFVRCWKDVSEHCGLVERGGSVP